jgi:glycosyltransferase involved in cell wall biosynthesis
MKVLLLDVATSGHRIEYAKYLSDYLIQSGHEIYYCTIGEDDRLQYLRDSGVSVNTFQINSATETISNKIQYRIQLYQYHQDVFELANNRNVDVVHHLFIDGAEVTLLLNLLMEKRSGWEFFATYFNQALTKPTTSSLKHIYRVGQRLSIKHLLNSNEICGLFVHHSQIYDKLADKLSLNKEHFSIVPDPIEPPASNNSKKKFRKKLSLPTDDIILLFFGETRSEKGADILLNSLKYIGDRRLTVVFAGPADNVGDHSIVDIQSQIDSNINIIPRFEFIPDEDIYSYFFASDAIVLPYRSEYRGTSGILQRAIASGRPVIGTDCGTVGTIISEWNAGVVVEPDSAPQFGRGIEEFIENKQHYEDMVQEITPEYIQSHHWKEMSAQILETYLEHPSNNIHSSNEKVDNAR